MAKTGARLIPIKTSTDRPLALSKLVQVSKVDYNDSLK